MYECLRNVGMIAVKVAESDMVSISEFKYHFESVSNQMYKEHRSVHLSVVERVKDKKIDDRLNVCLMRRVRGRKT